MDYKPINIYKLNLILTNKFPKIIKFQTNKFLTYFPIKISLII